MNYAPFIFATRLFQKVSAKGNTYLVGRWGGLRVTILRHREDSHEGDPIWHLMFSEAPQYHGNKGNGESDEGKADR